MRRAAAALATLAAPPPTAAAAPAPPNPSFACPQSSCWCAPTYANGSVGVTKDIVYGSAWNKLTQSEQKLLLDVYEPPVRAGAPPRPAAVIIHGGGFRPSNPHTNESHTKSMPPFVDMATKFAAKGFVAVSIDYRSERDLMNASTELDPLHDARAAVRWLVAERAARNIDASRIAAFGGSAGAITVENLCLIPGDGDDAGNAGAASNITAGVSLSGQFATEFHAMAVTKDARPLLDIHGTSDPTVPYSGAVATKEWLDSQGAPNWLVSIPGAKHTPFSKLDQEPYKTDLWGFLRQEMRLDEAACPPQ